jgi:hypothetical protein
MATTATEQTRHPAAEASLRWGSWLMGVAAVGFIGYAVIFLVRNFTDSFLELGIGPNEVQVGKDAIQAFSPSLFHYISLLVLSCSSSSVGVLEPSVLCGRGLGREDIEVRLACERSAQHQQVKPVASGFRVGCVLGMSYGTAETFFAAEELLVSETAHRGVGVAEGVHLAEEVRQAGRVVSRTCSRASWWNPAVANAVHVSFKEG